MIVGTAGHIDHGKTSLVRALTGVDTDRLKDEKARGITLDLGFAYMPGPHGQAPIGFIDVPGHERLVRTMVAGSSGIDFALLAIAADDGIMPQTREHLDILFLLGLTRGLIAVTKIDRVDPERRTAVLHEIAAAIHATPFAGFGLVPVSSVTGEGLGTLRDRLMEAAAQSAERPRRGLFRMPVDRSFALPGIGTVATGTVMSGQVAVGDEFTILPGMNVARVRSLHVQNEAAAEGHAGQRCALALTGSGIGRDVLHRGSWVCASASLFETDRIDVELRLLTGAAQPLRHDTPAHLHCGASDVPARLTLLGRGVLQPGEEKLAQLRLQTALPLRTGDQFVLRDASGQRTVGGGTVIDPRAPARRRHGAERLRRLAEMRLRDPADALAAMLAGGTGFESLDVFAADRGLDATEVDEICARLDLAKLRHGATTYVHTKERWVSVKQQILDRLSAHHAEHPDLPGTVAETLRLALDPILPKLVFEAICDRLGTEGAIARQGHWWRLPDHVAALRDDDRLLAERLRPLLAQEPFRPPRVRDIGRELGQPEEHVRRTCKALARAGEITEVAHDHFFLRGAVAAMACIADDLTSGSASGVFGAAEFRDRLGGGRKLAIQILDFFDHQGFTRRRGDLRRVVKASVPLFGHPDSTEPSRSPL